MVGVRTVTSFSNAEYTANRHSLSSQLKNEAMPVERERENDSESWTSRVLPRRLTLSEEGRLTFSLLDRSIRVAARAECTYGNSPTTRSRNK